MRPFHRTMKTAWGKRTIGGAAVLVLMGVAVSLSLVLSRRVEPTAQAAVTEITPRESQAPIQPIAHAVLGAKSLERAKIGKRLFADRRLSADDSVSCADCHDLAHGGVDARRTAVGIHGHVGPVNTPTVFNAALNTKQFWDGRAESLETQVDGPLLGALEMGSTWSKVVEELRGDDDYRAAFAKAYPSSAITPQDVRDAIATYERTLTTPDSRFDRFLRGDATALRPAEREGYEHFKTYGCVSCHQGRNVGGNLFEKLGVMGDYFAERGGDLAPADFGRFNVTHREEDRFRFRVPSLRLVAQTAPYFHDGRVETLREAVVLMGRYQLGEEIPADDVTEIVAFLGTLAGAPTAEGTL